MKIEGACHPVISVPLSALRHHARHRKRYGSSRTRPFLFFSISKSFWFTLKCLPMVEKQNCGERHLLINLWGWLTFLCWHLPISPTICWFLAETEAGPPATLQENKKTKEKKSVNEMWGYDLTIIINLTLFVSSRDTRGVVSILISMPSLVAATLFSFQRHQQPR